MTENHQEKLEAIIDEMLLEDPDVGYDTLARWCGRFPEHRDELAKFAAIHAVQETRQDEPRIDEARVTSRLMSHALGILHRQASAKATTPAADIRLCEAIANSGVSEDDFGRICDLDETLIEKLNRRLIKAASIPLVACERIASAISLEVANVQQLFAGDPVPLTAYKSRTRPAVQPEEFLDAVKSSELSDSSKDEWTRIIEAEKQNEGA